MSMNLEHLKRNLNSVGKGAFVEYFEVFQNVALGTIDRKTAIEAIVETGRSNHSGATRRVGNAKQIFEAHQELDALDMIVASPRLSAELIEQARRLRQKNR